MDNNETTWLSTSESEKLNNSLHWNKNTEIMNPMAIYVFAPSRITAIRVVSIILSVTQWCSGVRWKFFDIFLSLENEVKKSNPDKSFYKELKPVRKKFVPFRPS